ncbi:MAG: 16S rRNA (adenine(1518)-N(6)/adenine(1519)-N(6))-dimethyltransferase RsmA [Minisyncoccia bacterium]
MTIQAKKSLGQNFLKNDGVLQKIADTGDISASDIVLEVGPGEGALTEKLLEKGCKVIAVEKDHRLIEILKEKFSKEIKNKKFELIEGDILSTPRTVLDIGKYKIIANIPYYITGQFLRKFLETDYQPSEIIVMVQKEIADRIVANDGKESILSISVKVYGSPEIIMKVSRGSFQPSPNVDSAVLQISNISKKLFTENSIEEEQFFEIIKLGFSSKRKMLLGNLKKEFPNKNLQQIFIDCKISEKIRAEDLSLEKWMGLVTQLRKDRP